MVIRIQRKKQEIIMQRIHIMQKKHVNCWSSLALRTWYLHAKGEYILLALLREHRTNQPMPRAWEQGRHQACYLKPNSIPKVRKPSNHLHPTGKYFVQRALIPGKLESCKLHHPWDPTGGGGHWTWMQRRKTNKKGWNRDMLNLTPDGG